MSKLPKIQCTASAILMVGLSLVAWNSFADRPRTNAQPAAETVAMFQAIENGQIEVSLTVKDDQQARIVAHNLTDKPLTIEMPEAYAAVPILAQNQGGGGEGGFLNLAPEKFASRKTTFICLEHGKPNPRSDMRYEIRPIETLTADPKVVALISAHGAGRASHAVAQAAAWHLQNGLTWEALAAKRRTHLGGGSEPYFSALQLKQATTFVAYLEKTVGEKNQKPAQTKSPSYSQGAVQFKKVEGR